MNGQEAVTTQDQQTEQKSFPMGDTESVFDGNDWNISFDESGHIQLNNAPKATPETPGIADSPDHLADSQSNQPASQQSDGNSPADARIAKLEGVVKQLTDVVIQMAAAPNSNSLKQGEDQQQYDLTDQGQLSHFIGTSINNALKPVMDILPKIVQRIEAQDSRATFGKDHDEALSHFRELVDGGALTARQAVELYQKIKGVNGNQSANTHGTVQTQVPRQTGTPEALISKANRVQTQSGINGSVTTTQRPVTTVRDAFEAALEQLS